MHRAFKKSISMTFTNSEKIQDTLPTAPVSLNKTDTSSFHISLSSDDSEISLADDASPVKNNPSTLCAEGNVASRKRPKSKLYGKKKRKLKNRVLEDEQNIDRDLFNLVKTIEPGEDSDSSHDTIILDAETDESSAEQSKNKPQKSCLQKSTFAFPNLLSLSSNSAKSNLVSLPSTSNLFGVSNSPKPILTSDSENIKPATLYVPGSSLVGDSKSAFGLVHSSKKLTQSGTIKKENFQNVNIQSIYAESEIDVDTCDTEIYKNVSQTPSSAKSQTAVNASDSQTLNSSSSKIEIKKEVVSPEHPGSFVSNDIHVSMTFEAEPNDLDDLPLSFLKNRSIKIEPSSENYSQADQSHNPLPILIKNELIDGNEISSVSDCSFVDLKNVASSVSSCENSHIAFLDKANERNGLSHTFLQLPVKIKTEPDIAICSGSLPNLPSSEILTSPTNQSLKNTVIGSTKKSSKHQKRGTKNKKKSQNRKLDTSEQTFIVNTNPQKSHADEEDTMSSCAVPKLLISIKSDSKANNIGINSINAIHNQSSLACKNIPEDKTNFVSDTSNIEECSDVKKRKTKKGRKQIKITDINFSNVSHSKTSESFSVTPVDISTDHPITKSVDNFAKVAHKNLSSPQNIKTSSNEVASTTAVQEHSELDEIKRFLNEEPTDAKTLASNTKKRKRDPKKGSSKKKNKNSCAQVLSSCDEVDSLAKNVISDTSIQRSQVFNSMKLSTTTDDATSESSIKNPIRENNDISLKEHNLHYRVASDLEKVSFIKKEPYDLLLSEESTSLSKTVNKKSTEVKIKKEPDLNSCEQLQSKQFFEKNIEAEVLSNLKVTAETSSTNVSDDKSANCSVGEETDQSFSTSEGTITHKVNKSPMKKKKRRTKNNWYKKKKSRNPQTSFNQIASNSEETVSAFESDSSALSTNVNSINTGEKLDFVSTSLSEMLQKKPMATVEISTLTDNVEISADASTKQMVSASNEKFSFDVVSGSDVIEQPPSFSKPLNVHLESENLNTSSILLNTTSLQKGNTPVPSKKRKRRRKGSSKRKKRKTVGKAKGENIVTAALESNSYLSNRVISSVAESEVGKIDCVEKFDVNEKSTQELNNEKIYNNDKAVDAIKDTVGIPFNCIKGLTPTLSIASMEKEIANFDNYVAAKGLSMGTIKENLNAEKNTMRLNVTDNSSTLTSVSSQKSNIKDDSCFLNSSLIQIKNEKELENTFSTSSDTLFKQGTEYISSVIPKIQHLNATKQSCCNSPVTNCANPVKQSMLDEQQMFKITNNDELACLVKKEVIDNTNVSSQTLKNNCKNVEDLIGISSMNSKVLTDNLTTPCNSKNSLKKLCHENDERENEFDDEIQIIDIQKVKTKTKEVLCVDLTDENLPVKVNNLSQNSPKESSSALFSSNQFKEPAKPFSIFYESSGEESKDDFKLNNTSNDLLSNILDGDKVTATEENFIDLVKVKQKYINEFLKYPYPPSLSILFKRRKNKVYSRLNSQTLNLSIKTVESRLKTLDNIKNQFGNKLDDTVKLEKYPVSNSEVECYHRILGVAPSQKLLLKCFKPSENKISVNNPLELCRNANSPETSKSFQENSSFANHNLIDIIKSMTVNSLMNNSKLQENTNNLRDNSIHTDTIFSCESISPKESSRLANVCFQNIKDLGSFPIQNNQDLTNPSSSDTVFINPHEKMNIQPSLSKNFVSSESNFESYDPKNLQLSINLVSQNVISTELPVNKIVSSPKNLYGGENNSTTLDHYSDSEQKLPANCYSNLNESNLTPDSLDNITEYINESSSNAPPVVDIDVETLRKIIQVIGNSADMTDSENRLWKTKKTYEYNHIQSVPVMQPNLEQNVQHSEPFEVNDVSFESSMTANTSHDKKLKHQDSDEDEYIDNEPATALSEGSDVDENEKDDQAEVPCYKSKWEKIMERKSLENREKGINEHLLKDCFPVSSKVPSKKMNTIDKDNAKERSKNSKKQSSVFAKHDVKVKSKIKNLESITKTKNRDKNKKPMSKTDIKSDSVKDSKNKKKTVVVTDEEMFAPDCVIKKTGDKKEKKMKDKQNIVNKSKENQPKKTCGRVTNRGEFLTQTTSSYLKNIKIPKKKNSDSSVAHNSKRSEEYHSLVDLPDIDFHSRNSSKYNSYNKRRISSQKIPSRETYHSSYNSEIKKVPPSEFHSKKTQENKLLDKNDLYLREHTHKEDSYHKNMPSHSAIINSNENRVYHRTTALLETPRTVLLDTPRTILLETPSSCLRVDSNPTNKIPSSHMHQNAEVIDPRVKHLNPTHSCFNQPKENSASQLHLTGNPESTPQVSANNDEKTLELVKNFLQAFSNNSSSMLLSNSNQHLEAGNGVEKNFLLPAFNYNYGKTTNLGAASVSTLPSLGPFAFSSPSMGVQNLHHQPISSICPSLEKQNPNLGGVQPIKPAVVNNISVSAPTATSICLVPCHLKSLVGEKIVETADVQLLMLEWSVDWLVQQQRFHDPPPISNCLKRVTSSYEIFEEHYTTYFPLMLLETWHRIYVSWMHLSQATPYFCDISSYSVKNNHVTVECQTVFNTASHPKGIYPDEGSMLMIKYGTKSKDFSIKILGYVTHVKKRRFNHVTDSRLGSFKPPKDGNFETLQVLTLSFMSAYNSEDIDKHLPVRIHVLCNVKATLKQNDALLYAKKSPLLHSILNPVEGGLISVALTPRNSSPEEINDCVRSITKGILSPHPLPLLTIVRAVPESDRLNIIPLLVEKMKSAYKTKVLLCVRTVRALGDVAANICLHEDLKMVIINKRGDTSQQFQKYLLDELVAAERSLVDSSKESLQAKNEAIIRTKKQIFQNSDVILSLIRNCHDEFMESTFVENDNVAQMCCIVDEAHLCTEPETLIPILHGISKLILIGDPDYPAKVVSKTATTYDYHRSFFHRAYDLDLITE